MGKERTLVVAPRVLPTVGPLARVAAWRGLEVVTHLTGGQGRLGSTHYYGGPKVGERLAGELAIGLLEPADDWLPNVPPEFAGRTVAAMSLGEAWALDGQAFVKPPSDKGFAAQVYRDGTDLREATGSLAEDTPVLVSEVVEFASEYRLFLLDGLVHAASRYATWGRLDPGPRDTVPAEVLEFAGRYLGEHGGELPGAVVLDVGVVAGRTAIVEANMAWFSEYYMADLDKVLDVVLRSAGPLDEVSPRDRRFVRTPS
ncbi:ATP-grasp domain-containing protein [Amycolatopsis sp. NPDC059657]|uniref:ATP-grasp domain-containing protein n=1 Tax=Amycolatopsis sp. NPDC059657 TaxID=3346899 RepID=UPI003672A913